MDRDKLLIVQGDLTVMLEVDHPLHAEVRDQLARFAELVKAPEHLHTWRITPLSIWNAAAGGMSAEEMIGVLEHYTRYPIPPHIHREIREQTAKYGRIRLTRQGPEIRLEVRDAELARDLADREAIRAYLVDERGPSAFSVLPLQRGALKRSLVKLGYPVEDLAGYAEGEPLPLQLRRTTGRGEPFEVRPYQEHAVATFHAGGGAQGGAGVVVLPCGAGKTIVGMGIMAEVQASTLILTTSVTAARQWIAELLDKTTLTADQIGEYTGQRKEIRPVTVTTYQMLTHRPVQGGPFPHFQLFDQRNWGLVVYDEVHLLPAPIFQITAGLQARRRLGLTATLVREDNAQDEVFALIGPRRFDVPWKAIEAQGWIARAQCAEVRVPLPPDLQREYNRAPQRTQHRISAENPAKLDLVRRILPRHPGTPALVIGMYIDQLKELSQALGAPLLTGQTSEAKRESLYEGFRRGEIPVLVVSKVANFSVDLPDAALAIQVSGTFGSRQEEAQRLGRLLRPKEGENRAWFYSLVTAGTVEQDFALHRQLFLVEQGYTYTIEDA